MVPTRRSGALDFCCGAAKTHSRVARGEVKICLGARTTRATRMPRWSRRVGVISNENPDIQHLRASETSRTVIEW
jgi:hypothetical protein